jgi:hypothetical protein
MITVYHKVEDNLRMTENEASERYPNEYVLMRPDSRRSNTGAVLYVGDSYNELFSLMCKMEDTLGVDDGVLLGVVVEGLQHRYSLGGVVVGE